MSFSVLVVTAQPDARRSTGVLCEIVQALDARAGVEVTTFFLRRGAMPHDGWGRCQVVDDLRTHPISRALSIFGPRPRGWFQGWMLRRRLRTIGPDVVVLDDGLGERVVHSIRTRPLVAIRPNAEPPAAAKLEPPPLRDADLVLQASADEVDTAESLDSDHLLHATRLAAPHRSAGVEVRGRFGIGEGEPLLLGWGPDPWLDGTGQFIRTLWYLHHRYDTPAHGLWLGLVPDHDALVELEMEIQRCGLDGYVHFEDRDDERTRWSGDAVFLPHRTELDSKQVLDAVAAGNTVVAYAPPVVNDPSFHTVAPLDLDSAARVLAVSLREDPQQRSDRTLRLDVGRWVSTFLRSVDAQVARG